MALRLAEDRLPLPGIGAVRFDDRRRERRLPLREHTDLPPDRIRARVAEILSWIDLEGIEDKLPSELSGGMQKRVGFARTIALEPETVIYDEPTTGLDPLTSDTISELIRRIQKERHVTSIVVTHDIRCTFHVADHVAMIDEGRILVKGTLDEIRKSEVPKVRHSSWMRKARYHRLSSCRSRWRWSWSRCSVRSRASSAAASRCGRFSAT
jgi:ABC-type transporter Mla maintaining outer membrane lipid asymmetry ATPase subunit MlaF